MVGLRRTQLAFPAGQQFLCCVGWGTMSHMQKRTQLPTSMMLPHWSHTESDAAVTNST